MLHLKNVKNNFFRIKLGSFEDYSYLCRCLPSEVGQVVNMYNYLKITYGYIAKYYIDIW